MTPFSALTSLAGLSLREVSDFHGVPLDTVKSWSNGRRRCPDGAINELTRLIATQEQAAAAALEQIRTVSATQAAAPEAVELGYPADDHEARSLGWPCVGAWRAMAARVIAASPAVICLVPRGSTLGTAGTSDARD